MGILPVNRLEACSTYLIDQQARSLFHLLIGFEKVELFELKLAIG
jgi:hypothetical protein